jgi:hypothetical protein
MYTLGRRILQRLDPLPSARTVSYAVYEPGTLCLSAPCQAALGVILTCIRVIHASPSSLNHD